MPPGPGGPSTAGAHLPVTYNAGELTGTVLYVAATGSDAAAGTKNAPLRTVAAAISRIPTKGTVVVAGGTYHDAGVHIPRGKDIDITAASGEIPVFDGSIRLDSGWSVSGATASHTYTTVGSSYGSGIDNDGAFSDVAGRYADQVWINGTAAKQVLSLAEVGAGKFYVDTAAGRIHLAAGDAAKTVDVSSGRTFLRIQGDGSSVRGLRIQRYSSNLGDYGVLRLDGDPSWSTGLSDITISDVEVDDSAMQAVQVTLGGGNRAVADIVNNVTFRNVTITDSNWMGVSVTLADNTTFDKVRIERSNMAGEWKFSPQTGAIKTARVRHFDVINSYVADNNSHAVWFDQSNIDVVVANNDIINNVGAGVFFEISDGLVLANNRIVAANNATSNAVKIAGSSGVRIVNNVILGGRDPLGVYTDSRSKPGCADPTQPLCSGSYSSERDSVRPLPATLDWMPRIDMLVNNVIGNPTSSGYCGGTASMCVTVKNAEATTTYEAIFHAAEPGRGIPRTVINGNVYNGAPVRAGGTYSTLAAWQGRISSAPFDVAGDDSSAKFGTGWVTADGYPTAALNAAAGDAAAVGVDAELNQWVPAGTRRYGTLD